MSVSPKESRTGSHGSTSLVMRTPNNPKRQRGDGFFPAKTVPALTLGVMWTFSLWGQEPIKLGSVVVSGSIRSRVESWEWFTPNIGDPSYTFMGNHLRLNFTRPGKRFDWTFE